MNNPLTAKERLLSRKMNLLNIKEEDIMEKFIRSAGPGGQNVNKASTCVYLKHIPTGIEVKCQQERSQAKNRHIARSLLVEKIEASLLKELSAEKENAQKLRRQQRKKPKALKLRILEEKRKHSQKKKLRLRVRDLE